MNMELIKVKEAAALLGISASTLYTWRWKYPERLSCYVYGDKEARGYHYDKAEVLAYIAGSKTKDGAA